MFLEVQGLSGFLWMETILLPLSLTLLWRPLLVKAGFRFSDSMLISFFSTAQMKDQMVFSLIFSFWLIFFHFSGEFYYSRFLIDFNPFCNEYNQWCPNAFLFLFLFLSFTLGLRVNFGLPLRKWQSLIYFKLL